MTEPARSLRSLGEDPRVDPDLLDRQRGQWVSTFTSNADMYGVAPSESAVAAASVFGAGGVARVLELGAGQGRDTIYLAKQGLAVTALDYADEALEAIDTKAAAPGLSDRPTTVRNDVRDPLPFEDASFDASYSHMLWCMALTTAELQRLAGEVRRVVRPGGLVVYTVRNTSDVHYGSDIARGDAMYEHGGFIVHFFHRDLIERLARGYELLEVAEFEEGELPRRLSRVTMRRP